MLMYAIELICNALGGYDYAQMADVNGGPTGRRIRGGLRVGRRNSS